MRLIKDGKPVLDGSMTQCELEEKLFKALEIIVDKKVNLKKFSDMLKAYGNSADYSVYKKVFTLSNNFGETMLTEDEFNLIKEVLR